MLKIFLWLRYLHKLRMVFLSIGAVSVCCGLLIVVSSLFTGFIDAFEQSAVDVMGDVVITPSVKVGDYEELIRRLEGLEAVKAATAVLRGQGLLHLGSGNVRAVELWGIEAERRGRVTNFKRSLILGRDSAEQISFGAEQAEALTGGFVGIGVVTEPNVVTDEYDFDKAGEMIGRSVILTTGRMSRAQGTDGGQAEVKRKTIKLRIADIVFTGIYGFDKGFVYLPIERLQQILYPQLQGSVATQIQIKLENGADTASALAQIRGLWRDFAAGHLGWSDSAIRYGEIETSRQLQSRMIGELKKQMGVLLLIFGVVSVSVVVLVFCIFYMVVTTKRKDIAIIKSCGMASSSVWAVFVGFGAVVGLTGAGLGVVIGYLVTKNINVIEQWIRIIFGLKLWKSSVYIFSRIPNEVDWWSVFVIASFAVAASAAGSFLPAVAAARTRPVDILRYE